MFPPRRLDFRKMVIARITVLNLQKGNGARAVSFSFLSIKKNYSRFNFLPDIHLTISPGIDVSRSILDISDSW